MFLQRSAVVAARRAAAAPVLRRSFATTVIRRESSGEDCRRPNWYLRHVTSPRWWRDQAQHVAPGLSSFEPTALLEPTLTDAPSSQRPARPASPSSLSSPLRRSLVCPPSPYSNRILELLWRAMRDLLSPRPPARPPEGRDGRTARTREKQADTQAHRC